MRRRRRDALAALPVKNIALFGLWRLSMKALAAIKLIPTGHGAGAAGGGHGRAVHPQDRRHRFGYRLAQQFGIPLVERRPGLVPLTFDGAGWAPYAQLAGLALPVQISTGAKKERMAFDEDLLFTHRGLSGPAVLQISSYWQEGTPLAINLAPTVDLPAALAQAKATLAQAASPTSWPRWCPAAWPTPGPQREADWQRPINEATDKALARLAEQLARWELTPTGTEGYKKAEVTLGGVDTRACRSRPWSASASRACISLAKWWT
jgi:predicted flavoprotein YhiN